MSAFKAGLRREAAPSIDVGDEPELVDRLRAEIAAHGPITFARFMERALYEPGLGYYRKSQAGPGREADFLTAPEMHPIFGRAIARQLDELWKALGNPAPFTLREHAAGTGALALGVLEGLTAERSKLLDVIRYEPVEVEEARAGAINRRLADAGFGWQVRAADEQSIVGIVFANELLDALPVHRVMWREGDLRELMVTVDGERFVQVDAAPSTPELAARLNAEGVALADGQIAEVCLELDAWMARAASSIERGLLLLIDYGYPAAELYSARRRAGTLMAYVRHRAHGDPFINVGRQDLTSHVDITAVETAAARAGLVTVGVTSQAEFLAGLGIGELLQAAQAEPGASLESYFELRASVVRLLDPRATGAFKVMAFGRDLPEGLRLKSFDFRIPPRLPGAGAVNPT
jgi:SAM-dependent MidA family methyltransferase